MDPYQQEFLPKPIYSKSKWNVFKNKDGTDTNLGKVRWILKTGGVTALQKKIRNTIYVIGRDSVVRFKEKYQKYWKFKKNLVNEVDIFTRKFDEKLGDRKFILVLSHDDYLSHVGGVQLNLTDERINANANGIAFVQVFPLENKLTLSQESAQEYFLGVNVDDQFLCSIRGDLFLESIHHIKPKLDRLEIHHLMGHSGDFISRLLSGMKEARKIFWAHDFFSACPNFTLLRNDKYPCCAPEIDSNSCLVCKYFGPRVQHKAFFDEIFGENEFELVAPSKFALDFIQSHTSLKPTQIYTHPHAAIEETDQAKTQPDPRDPLRIGYLGAPMRHKGWDVFEQMTDVYLGNPSYKFMVFSALRPPRGNYDHVKVEVNAADRNAMVSAVKNSRVDAVILWSLSPETFSFTLYESRAANCFIITNSFSGNIAATIKDLPEEGIVYSDAEELTKAFADGSLRMRIQDHRKSLRKARKMKLQKGFIL